MKCNQNNKNQCSVIDVEKLLKNIPSDKNIDKNVDILKSIADPTRLKILYLLKEGELCACEIIETINKSQSTISHHLNILKKSGVINARKEGTWVYYKLSDELILKYLDQFFKLIQ